MALWSFGTNRNGQLGDGSVTDRLEPVILETLHGNQIQSIDCGDSHTLALSIMGDVVSWGRGRDGQLGIGSRKQAQPTPETVRSLEDYRVTAVACGAYHSIAITSEGRVFQWGRLYKMTEPSKLPKRKSAMAAQHSIWQFTYGTASLQGDVVSMPSEARPYYQTLPIEVYGMGHVVCASAGYGFTVCVDNDGHVYSMGINDRYQLGIGHRNAVIEPTPVILPDEEARIQMVSCGEQHTLLLSEDGQVFSFGLGVFGQLGHGSLGDEPMPKLVESLANERVVHIACGSHHSVCTTDEGVVYVWGNKEYSQHGGRTEFEDLGSRTIKETRTHAHPRPVEGLSHIVKVTCGNLFSIALDDTGVLYAWGWGSSGSLGVGSRRYRLKPVRIVRLEGENIGYIAAGAKHVVAINTGADATFAFAFKTVLTTGRFADLAFLVMGRWMKAHKAMIYARCPRLTAMIMMQERFGGNYKDSDGCQIIQINNIRYATFKALLLYIYTDHLSVPVHFATELMELSVSWSMPRLTALCRRLLLKADMMISHITIPKSTFKDDLRDALGDEQTADCRFIMPSSPCIYAHRGILSARNQYFRTVFSSQFVEATKKEIKLLEIDRHAFMLALSYLYSGDESIVTTADGDMLIALIAVADRFIMTELKQLVERVIENALNSSNACTCLEVGDMYDASRLRYSALRMLEREWKAGNLQKSQDLGYLWLDFPFLARELDHRLASLSLCGDGDVLKAARAIATQDSDSSCFLFCRSHAK